MLIQTTFPIIFALLIVFIYISGIPTFIPDNLWLSLEIKWQQATSTFLSILCYCDNYCNCCSGYCRFQHLYLFTRWLVIIVKDRVTSCDFKSTAPSSGLLFQSLREFSQNSDCPVGWGCRIHRLPFGRGVRPLPNECPRYDSKQSDGEVPIMLEVWGMQSTLSMPLLTCPLRTGGVAPDRVLSMGQIELNCVIILNWVVWNRTVLIFNYL